MLSENGISPVRSVTSPLPAAPVDSGQAARNKPELRASAATKLAPSTETRTELQQSGIEPLESRLPVEVLDNPDLAQAEWAWRSEILAHLIQSHADQAGNTATATIQTLWRLLAALAPSTDAADWEAEWPASSGQPPLLMMSDIGLEQWRRLPEKVKRWVMRDRLTSVVETPGGLRRGEGVYLSAVNRVVPSGEGFAQGPQRLVAHRWKGERRSREVAPGTKVHLLRLDLRVGADPVRLTLICCKPSLNVHLASDNAVLRKYLGAGMDKLRASLEKLGWSMDRWTTSGLSRPDEEA